MGGLNWWVSQVAANGASGRDLVREAFANDPGETWARNGEMCPRTGSTGGPMPVDGLASLTFNAASNRITTAGFAYDAAGNQTQTVRVDGSLQRFQYDAANRLVKVFDGNGYTLQTVTYGAATSRRRVSPMLLNRHWSISSRHCPISTATSTPWRQCSTPPSKPFASTSTKIGAPVSASRGGCALAKKANPSCCVGQY